MTHRFLKTWLRCYVVFTALMFVWVIGRWYAAAPLVYTRGDQVLDFVSQSVIVGGLIAWIVRLHDKAYPSTKGEQ